MHCFHCIDWILGVADASELLPCGRDEVKMDRTPQSATDPTLDFDFLVQVSGAEGRVMT